MKKGREKGEKEEKRKQGRISTKFRGGGEFFWLARIYTPDRKTENQEEMLVLGILMIEGHVVAEGVLVGVCLAADSARLGARAEVHAVDVILHPTLPPHLLNQARTFQICLERK